MKVRSHRWRAGAAVAGAMLWIVSCATPSQWNSVRQQVEDIRRQVDLVQAQQQRSREAVEEWQAAGPERAPAQPTVGGQDEKGASGGPATAASPSRGATTADAQALYRRGYALYHQGDFAGAAEALEAYLKMAPDSPEADNAQYWIGESLYARGLYRQALDSFRLVTERYPDGDKAPHALYKMALCHDELGEPEQARFALQTVVRAFPDSDVAPLARRRLERP